MMVDGTITSGFTSDVVIGMEIHVSLDTERKLFCSCRNRSSKQPNTNVCPICLGHPGSRPKLNHEAVYHASRLASAMDFTIADYLMFSRKVYFYPDLAKNFQITQYEEPIGSDGKIIIGDRSIGLERVHIEEDPGSVQRKPTHSLVDYNRSGSPLCEIVTKPEMTSAKEARELLRKILAILEHIKVWNPSTGNLKVDLNISIKETGYNKVEVKGVSGLKEIYDAISYEILRQRDEPASVVQETRSYDPVNGITETMRKKESEEDYGYIYESDIVPRHLTEGYKRSIVESLPELPDHIISRLLSSGVPEEYALSIAYSRPLSAMMKMAETKYGDEHEPAKMSRFIKREVQSILNEGAIDPDEMLVEETSSKILETMSLFLKRSINNHSAKELLHKIAEGSLSGTDVKGFAEKNNMLVQSDIDIGEICSQVIKENPKPAEDYRSGKRWAINYLVGQVMKKTKGKALPDEAKENLKRILEE